MLNKKYHSPNIKVYLLEDRELMDVFTASGEADFTDIWD